jgi:hypothetical protein
MNLRLRNVNKVARLAFLADFQSIAPPHSNLTLDDVENSVQLPMVMRPGLGVRLNRQFARPQPGCSRSVSFSRREVGISTQLRVDRLVLIANGGTQDRPGTTFLPFDEPARVGQRVHEMTR